MKKIRLNVADFTTTEILSREQLKSVFGGSGSGSGSGDPCDKGTTSCDAFACYKPGVSSGICKKQSGACTCVSV